MTMVLVATGDSVITRRLPPYPDPGFVRLEELIRSADAAFTNLEVVLNDYQGWPVVEAGGMNLSAEPAVLSDLKRMGFNLVAFCSNHSLNYGFDGLLSTLRALKSEHLVYAGAGHTLAEARMPSYLETTSGRVGLVACASTFAGGQRAGEQRSDAPGRPGLNPQRFDTHYIVDREHLEAIRRIAELTGAERQRQRRVWLGFSQPVGENQVVFAERSFLLGDEFGIRTVAHPGDLAANTRSVQRAAAMSDLCVVSIHAHEQGAEPEHPADFLVEFAHACIDAGADVVLGHGPHFLRGLELYRGRPIFYSLGDFIFQYEYISRLPADDYETLGASFELSAEQVMHDHLSGGGERGFVAHRCFWETVIPRMVFDGHQLRELSLHPVSLGHGLSWPNRGTPRMSDADQGQVILEDFAALSRPFGTELEIRDGVGIVPCR